MFGGAQVYLDETGANGSSLAHAFENAPERRQLVSDAAQAAQFRQRIAEIADACERQVDGCYSR
jgi:hypothetical protein